MSPPTPPATRGVLKGGWNHNIGLVGVAGCGKSTVAVWRMLEIAAKEPCYLLAHDPQYALPSQLPDGRKVNIVRHETVAKAARALQQNPGALHAITCVDATEVVRLGNQIGERSIVAGKGRGAPVLVLVDEVTNCKDMSPRSLGPALQEALTLRRHRHCGLVWTTQSPYLVHYQFLSQATELYVFRIESERDLKRLIEDAGFPESSAAQIKTLNKFQFLRNRPIGFTSPGAE